MVLWKTHPTHRFSLSLSVSASVCLSHTHREKYRCVNVLKSLLELAGTEQKDVRALNRIFLSFVSINAYFNVYYKLAS